MKRVFAHIGFSSALTIIILNFIPFSFAVPICGFVLVAFIVSMAFPSVRKALAVPMVLASSFLACIVFIAVMNGSVLPQQQLDSKSAQCTLTILDNGKKSDDSYSYTAKVTSININGATNNFKIHLKSKKRIKCDVYDNIYGNVKFYSIADNAFKSYGYFSDGVYLTAKLDIYTVIQSGYRPPMYYVIKLRSAIESKINSAVQGDAGGLMSALVTGDKSNLSDDAVNAFRDCGVSHLVAVSGFHLSVIIGSLYLLLKKLFVPDKINVPITMVIMILYDGIAAFTPSVIRASIMMSIMLIGKLFSRKADSLNSLGIAVFVLCLNPFSVSDAGALLSVTSVLSLLTFYPFLRKKFKSKYKLLNYLFNSICVSTSVLVYTTPIMWFFYGRACFISIIMNIFMIPLAQFTMIATLIMLMFNKIGIVGAVITSFARVGSVAMLWLTQKVSSSFITGIDISGEFTGIAVATVFLIIGIALIIDNDKLKKYSYVVSLLVFISIMLLGYSSQLNNTYIIVPDSGSQSILIYNSYNSVVIGDMSKNDYYSYKRILSSKNIGIKLMVVSGYNSSTYNQRLSQIIKTDCIVSTSDIQINELYSYANDVLYSNKFDNVCVDENITLSYGKSGKDFMCVGRIGSKTFAVCDGNVTLKSQYDVFIDDGVNANNQTTLCQIKPSEEKNKGNVILVFREGRNVMATRENIWLQ